MNVIGSKLLKRLVVAVIAVVSLTAILSGCSLIKNASKSDTAKAKVGECINVQEASMTKAKTEPIDCSKPEAVYKVVSTQDKKVECGDDYTSYTESRGSSTNAYLCLVPNFKEGSCYKDSMMSGYKYAQCGTADASFKVVKRVEGSADASSCPRDRKATVTKKPITIEKEKLTFCLGPGK